MDRHLVAVEVRVERGAHERVDLDGLALDQHRLEGLDAESVERRGAVEEHGVLLDHVLENVPDFGTQPLDHLLGTPDVRGERPVDEHLHHERLEELDRHETRQAALVHLEPGSDHDHRPAGVVHALAEEVLAETPLLALEHIGQGFQGAVAGACDGAAPAAVVEEGVDGLLEHPLLVVHDYVGRPEVEQAAEPVVTVYDPSIKVVQVGGCEASAVELDHRAEVRREDRDGLHDHPLGAVPAGAERVHDLQALDGLLALLALGRADGVAQVLSLLHEVYLLDKVPYGLSTHAAAEVHAVAVLVAEAVLHLAE